MFHKNRRATYLPTRWGGAGAGHLTTPMMTYFSQRDPRWADDKLGASKIDMHHYGCTTTCIAMLTTYFGCPTFPDAIARLKRNYTKDGLIIWGNLSFSCMKWDWREYGYSALKVQQALNHPDRAVILEINNHKHWVVAARRSFFGDSYVCVDPWTGKKITVDAKDITGSSFFSRKK